MDEGYYKPVATTPEGAEERENPFDHSWHEACDETELITNEEWHPRKSDAEESSDTDCSSSSPEELNREDFNVSDAEIPPSLPNGLQNNNTKNGTCVKVGEGGGNCGNPACPQNSGDDIVTVWVSDSDAAAGFCACLRRLRCGYWVAAASCVLIAGIITTLWVWTQHGRHSGALDDASTATAVLVGPALTLLGVIGVFVACIVHEVQERRRYDPLQEDAPPTEEFL